ncbi:sirohydrochlorin chelatase [Tepidibacillus fermentans]|uniref:Sirohydrochlorin ferrochelatase n=1 Tax=Tepidibacillus fermentans TaxID=1281767 RepID=A0A4R3KC17_9BACI|nr:CbiX/SirB N-terminal domain-containing protein [Tepidibacillus fermentans]TCS80585.1 sirohydrochlorin ferrochelatase [Tepidibacillus fermentans]
MGKRGVWIIGHGSSNPRWLDYVDQMIAKLESPSPIVLSFLEKAEGRLIEDGIRQLRGFGIKEVFVIPLFVSSGSTHIAEIQEILSQYRQEFTFIFGSCMNDHPLVVQHIIDQAKELSDNCNQESLLMIAHGSDEDDFQQKWKEILESLTKQIKEKTNFLRVDYATFLPNTILKRLEGLKNTSKQILIVPLFLSKGIFTEERIPAMIQWYPVKYNGKAYLPNDWITEWIQEQIDQYYVKE